MRSRGVVLRHIIINMKQEAFSSWKLKTVNGKAPLRQDALKYFLFLGHCCCGIHVCGIFAYQDVSKNIDMR